MKFLLITMMLLLLIILFYCYFVELVELVRQIMPHSEYKHIQQGDIQREQDILR